jgi:hypothetical protein
MSTERPGATITPAPEADCCGAAGCHADELLATVEPDAVDERRVLCPTHRVEWLREVSADE